VAHHEIRSQLKFSFVLGLMSLPYGRNMDPQTIPTSHRDLLETPIPATLASLNPADLASFAAPLEGRVTVILRPIHVVPLG
jgi:hypothetical protein